MKTAILTVLLVLSLAANGLLWRRVTTIEQRMADEAADYPLGEMMGYMQRYASKLWFAGEAENWDLAEFYRGEIAETEEAIADAHVTKDGIEVSRLIGTMLPPSIEAVTKAVAARDPAAFRASYRTMVNTCNACHRDAKHPFIQIAAPVGPPTYWNQHFDGPSAAEP